MNSFQTPEKSQKYLKIVHILAVYVEWRIKIVMCNLYREIKEV